MEIGVGTPATIPGADAESILGWARKADAGPWSTLGIIDRIAYPNHEPLMTLAALAGATRRIRLMTTVLVAPIRTTGLLAKQAATVDSLSGGRLVLGLGIGNREDDYAAASSSTDFRRRASHLEEQVDLLRSIWRGDAPSDGVAPIGPRPAQDGGPPIYLGAYSEAAARRAGAITDGYIAGPIPPSDARGFYEAAADAHAERGRTDRLRFVGCAYWALGDDMVLEAGRDYLRDYYAYGGRGDRVAAMLDSPEAIAVRLGEAEVAGMDEIILWPCVGDRDQLDRLAEVTG